jgi:TonB-dependent SusC/RagA subfamily outer membrane receptor
MRVLRVLATTFLGVFVSSPLAAQATGSVKGRVLETGTSQPIVGASVVIVVGSARLGELTGNNGTYVVRSVPAGQVLVRALRIGYAPDTVRVDVPASGEVTADFSLAKVATELEAVVTTATGDQSRKEIGNVIASVSVDSLAGRAPVTNITEVLQARTPGVQIIQGSGLTGASPSIRIRGTSSLSLSNEPLIIVDGVRVDNSAQPAAVAGASVVTTRVNRFGAFNADDVESIDIIKGPSAAALYGTAAANGVLVIKTKRGASSGCSLVTRSYTARPMTSGR